MFGEQETRTMLHPVPVVASTTKKWHGVDQKVEEPNMVQVDKTNLAFIEDDETEMHRIFLTTTER